MLPFQGAGTSTESTLVHFDAFFLPVGGKKPSAKGKSQLKGCLVMGRKRSAKELFGFAASVAYSSSTAAWFPLPQHISCLCIIQRVPLAWKHSQALWDRRCYMKAIFPLALAGKTSFLEFQVHLH